MKVDVIGLSVAATLATPASSQWSTTGTAGQFVAMCCSALQCVAEEHERHLVQCVVVPCSVLQCVAEEQERDQRHPIYIFVIVYEYAP